MPALIEIVFSSAPIEVKALQENKNIVLSGQWLNEKDKLTGGCHLNDKEYIDEESKQTWSTNPQYLLKLLSKEPAEVRITLSRPERDKLWKEQIGKELVGCMIGFYVFFQDDQISQETILNKDTLKFIPWNEISEKITLEGGRGYIIMPCTYKPGIKGPFTLAVNSEAEFTLELKE